MASGSLLTPSSSSAYPSPPHEEFHPPRGSYGVSPPTTMLTSLTKPIITRQCHTLKHRINHHLLCSLPINRLHRKPIEPTHVALYLCRENQCKSHWLRIPLQHFPLHRDIPTSALSNSHDLSFFALPVHFAPQATSPLQSSSRSHSPTSTELPDYSSAHVPYPSAQISRPPLQVSINTSSHPQPARPELAPYLENAYRPSPLIDNAARPTPPLLRIPNSPVQSTTSSSPTDERRPWYRGRVSVPPSTSGSSDSSGGKSATSNVAPQLPPSTFVFLVRVP